MRISTHLFPLFVSLAWCISGCGQPPHVFEEETPHPTQARQQPTEPTQPDEETFNIQCETLHTNTDHPYPGQKVTFSAQLRNAGETPSSPGKLVYRLSTHRFDRQGRYLNHDLIPALPEGGQSTQFAHFTLPHTTPGRHYISVRWEGQDGSSRWVGIHPITVTEPPPLQLPPQAQKADLIVEQSLLSRRQAQYAEHVSITSNIRNIGKEEASKVRVRYYLSRDHILSSSDRYLSYDTIKSLKGGQFCTKQAGFHVPHNQLPGDYFVLIVIDPLEKNDEFNKKNNIKALPFSIHRQP